MVYIVIYVRDMPESPHVLILVAHRGPIAPRWCVCVDSCLKWWLFVHDKSVRLTDIENYIVGVVSVDKSDLIDWYINIVLQR